MTQETYDASVISTVLLFGIDRHPHVGRRVMSRGKPEGGGRRG
jgi:hypothetical protein